MSEENQQYEPPTIFHEKNEIIPGGGDAAGVARAVQEIQAALVIAQKMGRDEIKCKARIINACKRRELAEVAEYEYSRGGTKITGPTIDLLRAIAARWGNLRYGWTEIERRDGASTVRAFAWDLFTNTQAERTFTIKHWRDTQGGGYALDDERDIYELLANSASRRVRACLEEVIDPDMVDAAIDQCRLTIRSGHTKTLADRAAAMLVAYGAYGVTQDMIERRLGNKLDGISENQMASLQRIYKALKDGVGKREDYFKPETAKPDFGKEPPQQPPATASQPPVADPVAEEADEAAAGLAPEQPPTEPPAPRQPKPQQSAFAQSAAPAAPAAAPAADRPGFNPVKAVRDLCKMAKVKEGVLVGYLAEIGQTDGSCASLEEVQMFKPTLLKFVAEHWTDTLADLKERIEK